MKDKFKIGDIVTLKDTYFPYEIYKIESIFDPSNNNLMEISSIEPPYVLELMPGSNLRHLTKTEAVKYMLSEKERGKG